MNEFQVLERNRAFARAMEHLRAAHGHIVAADHENASFGLGLTLQYTAKTVLDAINRCAHVYKQPPETPA